MNEEATIVEGERAARHEWRCRCAIRPLLAMVTDALMVHVQVSGRRSFPLHYLYDLKGARPFYVHCPACHTWRMLRYDEKMDTIYDEQIPDAERPHVYCVCDPSHPKYHARA